MTGKTLVGAPPPPPPPPPPVMTGKSVPVKLYALSLFGPPQNSELFPTHNMSQSPAAAGAPPFENDDPQSENSQCYAQKLEEHATRTAFTIKIPSVIENMNTENGKRTPRIPFQPEETQRQNRQQYMPRL